MDVTDVVGVVTTDVDANANVVNVKNAVNATNAVNVIAVIVTDVTVTVVVTAIGNSSTGIYRTGFNLVLPSSFLAT